MERIHLICRVFTQRRLSQAQTQTETRRQAKTIAEKKDDTAPKTVRICSLLLKCTGENAKFDESHVKSVCTMLSPPTLILGKTLRHLLPEGCIWPSDVGLVWLGHFQVFCETKILTTIVFGEIPYRATTQM